MLLSPFTNLSIICHLILLSEFADETVTNSESQEITRVGPIFS